MSLSSSRNEDYNNIDYWNSRYEDEEEFDWCKDYSVIQSLLKKYVKPQDSILMLGCGNSGLSNAMYDDGYHSITNVDFSPVVIKKMSEAYPHMNWKVMDMLNLEFPISTFDVVIEKATLDVLFVKEKSPWEVSEDVSKSMTQVLDGVSRVLKKDGNFLSITFAQPHFRNKFYKQFWSNCKNETFGSGFHYYFYINTNKETS